MTAYLPMRWAARLDLNEALREGGPASASRSSNLLRGGLVVLQMALTFALLVGAGLSLRGLERLQGIDPGYRLKDVHVALVVLRQTGSQERALAFQRQVLAALGQAPGIQGVAMANTRPLVAQAHSADVWPEGGQGSLEAGLHAVSPDYFQTLGQPLLAGRNLEESEANVCLVTRQFAQRAWGEASPLGRRVRVNGANHPALTVVGVVGEARMSRLAQAPLPAVYSPLAREDAGFLSIYLRSAAAAAAVQEQVRQTVALADPAAQLRECQPLEALAARELEGPRQLRWQTLTAALLAALLTGVGLAGTLAQAAARQKREWGIRIALGARPSQLGWMIFRRVLGLLGVGLPLGGALAWALGQVLQHQFQGVQLADPRVLLAATLLLGLTGFLAGLVPALRAARMRPAEALRSE